MKLFEWVKDRKGINTGEFDQLMKSEEIFNPVEKGFLRGGNYVRFTVSEELHGFEVFLVREPSEGTLVGESVMLFHEGLFGAPVPRDTRSTDLTSDITAMWDKVIKVKDGYLPSQEALNAAIRVFNTVDLEGKTPAEIFNLLGDPKTKNQTIYKRPFWELEEDVIYFIWENGNYGIQYDIHFNKHQRATKVVQRWIH